MSVPPWPDHPEGLRRQEFQRDLPPHMVRRAPREAGVPQWHLPPVPPRQQFSHRFPHSDSTHTLISPLVQHQYRHNTTFTHETPSSSKPLPPPPTVPMDNTFRPNSVQPLHSRPSTHSNNIPFRPNSVQPHQVPLPASHSSAHIISRPPSVTHSPLARPFSSNAVPLHPVHVQSRPPSIVHSRPPSAVISRPPSVHSRPPSALPPRPLSIDHNAVRSAPPVMNNQPFHHVPPFVPQFHPPPLHHPIPRVPFQPPSPHFPPPAPSAPPSVPPVPAAPIELPSAFANPTEIAVNDLKNTLPSLSIIPTLRSAADWVTWESAVFRVVEALGLQGYICRIPQPGELRDPTSRVVLPPQYDFDSPPEVVEEYRVFWLHNNIVDHVVIGKLAPEIAGSLPPKRTGPYNLPTRTARDTLEYLRARFSVGSASSAEALKDGVLKLTCHAPGMVQKYVESWRAAVHQLVGSVWDFTDFQKTQKFVDGLPPGGGWLVLKERVRHHWQLHNSIAPADFSFATLTTEALDIHQKWKAQNPQT
ncbi:hypothetical protein H0H93_010564, partial [Arthromyces matolae]